MLYLMLFFHQPSAAFYLIFIYLFIFDKLFYILFNDNLVLVFIWIVTTLPFS